MIRVLIASDEPIRAKGLEAVLIAGGLEIASICYDVAQLFASVRCRTPDVAVLDSAVLCTPDLVSDLHRMAPRCLAVPWPRLSLSDSPVRLVEAITVMAQFSTQDASPSVRVDFACNDRERELVTLAGHGLNNEEIAAVLGWTRSAVEEALRSVSDRLGAGDRYELALYGLSTLNQKLQNERRM